ncbi:arginyl-tRNA synthetase [Renibacterium salmoninarum ATCC 33209]|uniref:Arginine--tRNA ligase n=1 Tax=Renibacterium salmoninarum (strain ATCC 33209 / DSM 20767 / JCM 11484 / NBRC 15589 / NCIMB 2235) TaxID=288705 RepID=SYR_RENSM|nr:arginine--tRNA ligase [Renibacterium salmoninarum]A9WNA7.1 RecName: Full=Arginine--tRNA ligase; AltName: Full=Arginyl-tRNA synthetase; Short=ArgRS [Renibacterium salmoninarum ATCC 33209]ABY23163.1 arginyl-tRNA synthetase [Renibacterium salmoninarum ATCC 33209]
MTPDELSVALTACLKAAVEAGELVVPTEAVPAEVRVERPKNRDHGDWATNIALQLAKPAGLNPRAVAEILKSRLEAIEGVAAVDIAGPGFLNITLDAAAAGALAKNIVHAGSQYGENQALTGQVINVEFVSANPTGPLHLAHTRWAAVGDSVARLLKASGATVTSEYYINDAGSQMNNFGASVLAAIKGEPTPEGGYPGAYITELAQQVVRDHPYVTELTDEAALPVVRAAAYLAQLADIKETLNDFGVHFDVFFSEQELHSTGAVEKAVDRLRGQGHVFYQDGAIWLRTTDFTDDKDRVLIRANGEPTYFAADAAYYLSKKDRGFVEKIYLLGADHHGYIGRLKAIAACAGDDPARNIEVLIGQMVSVNGARLSKRAGNIVELRDLLNWLGADALRYSLGRSPADSPLALEPEQLQKASNDNPVFYVQYAHARTKAVDRNAEAAGVDRSAFEASLLTHPTESNLLAQLGAFPSVVAEAAKFREPHRVARHLEVVAGTYHRWYDACRVTPFAGEEITDLNRTRLWLNDATGQVLANGLDLLGVSAPERM